MAAKVLTRSIFTINRSIFTTKQTLSCYYTSLSLSTSPFSSISSFSFSCQGPLVALAATRGHRSPMEAALRGFATSETTSSLNNSSPIGLDRPLLDGCDSDHYWLVKMEEPDDNPSRREIIDTYIKTVAQVIGSEDEARMRMYSVYPRYPFIFGVLVSEEHAYKIKELPKVRSVRPDPYADFRRKKEPREEPGCDYEHWLVVMDKPEGDPTRDEIIDLYIKTLAQVVGSEEEARMKIYSVSTKYYYGFGALLSEELYDKIHELPEVRYVLPDSYEDVTNKKYCGEPFINGQAVPYDPKYHETLARAEESRKNPHVRIFDPAGKLKRRKKIGDQVIHNMGEGPNMGGMPQGNMGGASSPDYGGALAT